MINLKESKKAAILAKFLVAQTNVKRHKSKAKKQKSTNKQV